MDSTSAEPSQAAAPDGVVALSEDPFVRKLLRDLLERRGYHVANVDADRMAKLQETGDVHVQMVITNHPGDFLNFADCTPMIYISSTPDPDLASKFRCCRTFRKPFRNEDLLAAVREFSAASIS